MISRLFFEYEKNPTSSHISYDRPFFYSMIIVLFVTMLIEIRSSDNIVDRFYHISFFFIDYNND